MKSDEKKSLLNNINQQGDPNFYNLKVNNNNNNNNNQINNNNFSNINSNSNINNNINNNNTNNKYNPNTNNNNNYNKLNSKEAEKQEKKKVKKIKKDTNSFFNSLLRKVKHDESKEELKKILLNTLELPSYQFTLYPYYLWIAGSIILLTTIFFTYLIYATFVHTKYYIFLVFINIILYYISFILFYYGKIEIFKINRKKGYVTLKKINIFGTKKQILYNFDQIDYIEIVMKGMLRGNDDHRKYFVRLYNKDKNLKPIEFGFTWYFETVKFKYQVCLSMIKGMIKLNVPKYYIRDEGEYLDYVY